VRAVVPDRALPNAVIVWVLQRVPDPVGLLAEAGRVVAPGGRLVLAPAGGNWIPDDIGDVVVPMSRALRVERDRPELLVAGAAGVGLELVARWSSPPWPRCGRCPTPHRRRERRKHDDVLVFTPAA
jgi:hypothetical protein